MSSEPRTRNLAKGFAGNRSEAAAPIHRFIQTSRVPSIILDLASEAEDATKWDFFTA